MLRRSIFSVALALAAVLALAAPALAGGVVVTLDGVPPDVQAGQAFTIGFMIFSAHDGSAQSGMEPTVTATNPATGESVTITAQPEGAAGHYVASFTLPSAGEWNWEIQPFGKYAENYPASVMTPLQVSAPAAETAPVVQNAPAAEPAPIESAQVAPAAESAPAAETVPAAPWLALAAIAVAAGIATTVLARRRMVARS
jgi:uncharacterized protein (DUF2141 family)